MKRFLLTKKGEVSHLNVPDNKAHCFVVELSWDSDHDLDTFALLGQNTDGRAKVLEAGHILSCHNVGQESNLIQHHDGAFSTPCGTITHSGDARDGIEDEIDETITIRCEHAPRGINEILVFAAVHQKEEAKQTFKGVKKSQVCVRSEAGEELGSYALSDFGRHTCVHVASIMLRPDGWECTLVGEGFVGDLNSILARLAPEGPTGVAASHVLAVQSELLSGPGAPVMESGIPISLEDLQKTNPSVSEDVLQHVCSLVRSFDLGNATIDICLSWGKTIQYAHTRIVKRWSRVHESQDLADLRNILSSLQDVLASIQIERFRSIGNEGILTRLRGRVERNREELLREFSGKKDEVDRIVAAIANKKRLLLQVRNRIHEISASLRELSENAMAFVLAGTHIETHMRQQSQMDDLAEVIEQRCDQLIRTQAELANSSGLSDLSVQQILKIIGIAETVVLVSVPTWLSSFMALHVALRQGSQLAQSDIDTVEFGLNRVSSSLKS